MGASRARAPSPSRVNGKAWQATRRRNPPCIPAARLRGGTVFSFYCKELFLAAIHGNQVRDELARHGERGAIGVAFLSLLVIQHGQLRTVAWCHFRCLDQRGLQMLVSLFGQRRALHGAAGTLLSTAQPAVADGFFDRRKTLYVPDLQSPGQRRD